jgi:hypothetical protein
MASPTRPLFDTHPVPDVLFRVARRPDVWQWLDFAYLGQGRWDDPNGSYRVLYASCSALGAFLETLGQFRPTIDLLAQIRENAKGFFSASSLPRVTSQWRAGHILGCGISDGVKAPLVAIGGATTLATLRRSLAPVARDLGIKEIDAGVIRLDWSDEFQEFTRAVSRFIYEQTQPDGTPYAGIYYLSKYADDVANCAIFERGTEFPVTSLERSEIEVNDPDFALACELLDIKAI